MTNEPGLFEEDAKSAEIYLYELDFHNQLKARLLEHKAAVQVVRETTLAPEEFPNKLGKPLRALQDSAARLRNSTRSGSYLLAIYWHSLLRYD